MEHTEAVAARLRDQIDELDREVESLRRALAALDGQDPQSEPGERDALFGTPLIEVRTRRAAHTRQTGKRRRSTDNAAERERGQGQAASAGEGHEQTAVSAEAVLATLRRGHTKAGDIADQLGVSADTVRLHLRELEQGGRIRRRRG